MSWQDLYETHHTPDPHTLGPGLAERKPVSRTLSLGLANLVVLAAGLITVAVR